MSDQKVEFCYRVFHTTIVVQKCSSVTYSLSFEMAILLSERLYQTCTMTVENRNAALL